MVSSEDQPDYDGKARAPQRAPFTITPKSLRQFARDRRDSDITQVYATLADYANQDGVCWPSQGTIATESGVSVRKVVTIIHLLHDAGFIRSERGQHRNMYTLLDAPTVQDVQSGTLVTLQDMHLTLQETTPHCAESAHITRTSKQEPVNQTLTPPSPPQRNGPPEEQRRTDLITRWKRLSGIDKPLASPPYEDAQALVRAECTDAEFTACFQRVKAWSRQGPSLRFIAKDLDEYRAQTGTKTSGAKTPAEQLAYLRAGKFTGNDHVMYVSGFGAKDNLARDIAKLEGRS